MDQSVATTALDRLVPRCAVCLQDYHLSPDIVKMPCGHVYCTGCQSKLMMTTGEFLCVFDRNTYSEEAMKTVLSLKPQIDSFVIQFQTSPPSPEEANSILEKIIGHVNTSRVPCKDLFDNGLCTSATQCPYSHASSSIELVRKLQSREQNSTVWECKNCLLTVSNKLVCCPVCDLEQDQSLLIPLKHQPNADHKESKDSSTNQTMDPIVIGDEEKSRFRMMAVKETTSVGGEDNLERVLGAEKSVCCVLQ